MDESIVFSITLSLRVAIVSTLLILVVGIPTAYFLARRDFRGREILDVVLTLPLVLPPTVTGYYLIVIFGRNGLLGHYLYDWIGLSITFTWYAAVLASFVVALPLMIKTARAAIESVDKNLINASYTLGHSEWHTATQVVLPLARRGIVAGTILSFARALGEFGATLMIAGNLPGKTDTMPIAIYNLASDGDWSRVHLMVLLLTLMSGVFLYAANRYSRRLL
ncbi:MAG: molybdate ABC transporter permease subunit [Gammaproteobacteria bacterium]|nr:molybdate ABC transporter permease subunit [Gammaproteobacteria bacterium]